MWAYPASVVTPLLQKNKETKKVKNIVLSLGLGVWIWINGNANPATVFSFKFASESFDKLIHAEK